MEEAYEDQEDDLKASIFVPLRVEDYTPKIPKYRVVDMSEEYKERQEELKKDLNKRIPTANLYIQMYSKFQNLQKLLSDLGDKLSRVSKPKSKSIPKTTKPRTPKKPKTRSLTEDEQEEFRNLSTLYAKLFNIVTEMRAQFKEDKFYSPEEKAIFRDDLNNKIIQANAYFNRLNELKAIRTGLTGLTGIK